MRMKFPLAVFILSLILLGAGCLSSANVSSDTEEKSIESSASDTKLDLSDRGLTQVSQDVFRQTNLVELDLSGNQLTGALPAEVRLLSKLEVLDLSNNAMTGVPAEIGQLSRLRTLDLSNNRLTGLPLELGQLTNLETLDLRGNDYSKYDLDQIRSKLPRATILVD